MRYLNMYNYCIDHINDEECLQKYAIKESLVPYIVWRLYAGL